MASSVDTAHAEEIRQRYLGVDASNVADVLDELGLVDQGLSPTFAPFPSGAGKLAGWAYPILGEMTPYPMTDRDPKKMKACAELFPGSVSVWAGAGEGVCFFGELIAIGMKESGSVGALVDGGVRDVTWLERIGYPVYARYRSAVQSIGRWKVTASGVPVSLPGATCAKVPVNPGDFILADQDGAIVVPAAVVTQVLTGAEELGASEVQIRKRLEAGMSLADALAEFGHV
jgi:4-hydroxy-4-methyl-2-oxoglutarate aldolase